MSTQTSSDVTIAEFAGISTSFYADLLFLRTGSFTDKADTISASIDSKGGLDVVGTGIYKNLTGTLFAGTHFASNTTVHVSFTDVLGAVFVDYTIGSANVCCFAAGTLIETIDGARRVETLTVGDMLWAFGRSAPVTWVGSRTIDVSTVDDRALVLPIRIRAGALSAGLPERDLVVSPDHAVWLDGKLIPARLLVNGVSIVQENRSEITYYHVALDRHDLILAEGVQVESYLNADESGAEPSLAIEAGPAIDAYGTRGFAPLCIDPVLVKPVWDALSARAGTSVAANDVVPTGAPFVLLVDGRVLHAEQIGNESGIARFGFDLPAGARLVTIASAAASPWSVSPWLDDRRRLGVAVSLVEANGVALPLQDPALVRGWHGVETAGCSYRWTDGAASLVLDGSVLRLEIGILAVANTSSIAIAA